MVLLAECLVHSNGLEAFYLQGYGVLESGIKFMGGDFFGFILFMYDI
jgi:hypothetical protein